MTSLLYLSAAVYHAVLIALVVRIGRRWWRRGAASPPAAGYGRALLGDAARLAAVALLLAVPAALPARLPVFALLRLLCQALFGEAVVLSLVVAVAHAARRHWWRAGVPTAVAALLLVVYWDAYHREPRRLELRRHALALAEAPAGAPLLRVAHLSDIQTDSVGEHEERAVRAAMAERPDLIVLTGDYLHARARPIGPRVVRDFRRLISGLQAPLGVFAVAGDVERDGCAILEGTSVTCLEDAGVRLALPGGRRLGLLGLAPESSRSARSAELARLLASLGEVDFRIVMGHAPDFVAALPGRPAVDLALAGHTHGGQVVVPGFGPPLTLTRLPRDYAGGLNVYRGVPLHVSRGIGMERGAAPQIRFFCPPELSLLELRYPPSRADPSLRAGG